MRGTLSVGTRAILEVRCCCSIPIVLVSSSVQKKSTTNTFACIIGNTNHTWCISIVRVGQLRARCMLGFAKGKYRRSKEQMNGLGLI